MKRIRIKRIRMILSSGEVLESNNITIGKVTGYILATQKDTKILAIEELDISNNKAIKVLLDNTK